MRDHIKIRKEYVRLVRAGKQEEAQQVLVKIWDRKNPIRIIKEEIPLESTVIKPVSKEIIEDSSLDSLIKIKGIGKKTILDIKKVFNNLDSLKRALLEDKVGLRDDIVDKLKKELIK
jgi:hypothetical protein